MTAATADRVASVMERYEAVIGIEVHCQLRTASKMFCGCSTAYADAAPNTHVCPVCLALPGTLPVINRRAVEFVIATGLAIDAAIPERTQWERKNYFYPDLPKGYQISQYAIPLAAARAAGDRDVGGAVHRGDHPRAPRGGHGEAGPRGRRRGVGRADDAGGLQPRRCAADGDRHRAGDPDGRAGPPLRRGAPARCSARSGSATPTWSAARCGSRRTCRCGDAGRSRSGRGSRSRT